MKKFNAPGTSMGEKAIRTSNKKPLFQGSPALETVLMGVDAVAPSPIYPGICKLKSRFLEDFEGFEAAHGS